MSILSCHYTDLKKLLVVVRDCVRLIDQILKEAWMCIWIILKHVENVTKVTGIVESALFTVVATDPVTC